MRTREGKSRVYICEQGACTSHSLLFMCSVCLRCLLSLSIFSMVPAATVRRHLGYPAVHAQQQVSSCKLQGDAYSTTRARAVYTCKDCIHLQRQHPSAQDDNWPNLPVAHARKTVGWPSTHQSRYRLRQRCNEVGWEVGMPSLDEAHHLTDNLQHGMATGGGAIEKACRVKPHTAWGRCVRGRVST